MKSNLLLLLKLIYLTWVLLQTPANHCAEPYMQFGDTGIVYDAEYSPDGTMIAVGTSTGFQILNAESYRLIHQEYTNKKNRIVKWLPDSKRILTVLDSFTGEIIESPYIELRNVSNEHLIFNVEQLIVEKEFNHPIYWRGLGENPFQNNLLTKNAINISQNLNYLSVISSNNVVDVIGINDLDMVHQFEFSVDIISTGFSENGEKLWIGTRENEILTYDTNTFQLIENIKVTNNENHSASILYYNPEQNYAISTFSRFDSFTTPMYLVYFLYYHNTLIPNDYTKLATSIPVRLKNEVYNLFFQSNTDTKIILNYSQYFPTNSKIELLEFTGNLRILKQKYFPSFFPFPFSPNGEIMLTNGSYNPTSNVLSVGALGDQPPKRILPLKPEPTVFDFHPTQPDILLTYSTNQNATEKSLLQEWDIPSQTVISSVTGVVMYEKGTFSPDGSLFASIEQPYNADPAKINVWDEGVIVPDIFLKVFNSQTWQLKYQTQILEDDQTFITDKVSFIKYSPNSQLVMIGIDWIMYLIENGNIVHSFNETIHTYGYAGDFSPNGKEVIVPQFSSGTDYSIRDYHFYNIETGEVKIIKNSFPNPIYIKYIDFGSKLLFVDFTGKTTIYDRNLETEYSVFGESSAQKQVVCLTPNEKYLFVDHEIWDVESEEMITTFGEEYGDLEVIKISPNNKWVATRHEDKILRVWDLDELVQQNTSVDEFVQY